MSTCKGCGIPSHPKCNLLGEFREYRGIHNNEPMSLVYARWHELVGHHEEVAKYVDFFGVRCACNWIEYESHGSRQNHPADKHESLKRCHEWREREGVNLAERLRQAATSSKISTFDKTMYLSAAEEIEYLKGEIERHAKRGS